jgi:hypothetical protein
MKSSVFRDIILYSPLKAHRRFGGTYRIHLQIEAEQDTSVKAGILLGVFDPEDGDDMLLRNVELSLNYKALEPLRPYSLFLFKTAVLWYITACFLVGTCRRFGGTFCFYSYLQLCL